MEEYIGFDSVGDHARKCGTVKPKLLMVSDHTNLTISTVLNV